MNKVDVYYHTMMYDVSLDEETPAIAVTLKSYFDSEGYIDEASTPEYALIRKAMHDNRCYEEREGVFDLNIPIEELVVELSKYNINLVKSESFSNHVDELLVDEML